MKIYGKSGSECEFLKHINSKFRVIECNSCEHYQALENNPDSILKEKEQKFDSDIEQIKDELTDLYSRNKSLRSSIRGLDNQIQYKTRAERKHKGTLRNTIRDEKRDLLQQKKEQTDEINHNESSINTLKSEKMNQIRKKSEYISGFQKDISILKSLQKESKFNKLRQGAFGEAKVISSIAERFKGLNVHLINGLTIGLQGSAFRHQDHTWNEARFDHVVVSNSGIYLVETKSWKNYQESWIQKTDEQMERFERVLKSILHQEKIPNSVIKPRLVYTERSIELKKFKSVDIRELLDEINKSPTILNNAEIISATKKLSQYMNRDHISQLGRFWLNLKYTLYRLTGSL